MFKKLPQLKNILTKRFAAPAPPADVGLASYTVIRPIGRGGYGTVFLAEDAKGQECVIKQVSIEKVAAKEKQKILREVRMLSQMSAHPYMVTYREAFLSDRHLCIVMEYCPGGELWSYLRKIRDQGRVLSEDAIWKWFAQLAIGLHYLHKDMKTLHRDLKTANVLLDQDQNLKITDFGLALALGATVGQAETVCGTPGYMAPEVIREEKYGMPADMWALGVILYEMVALDLPFKASNVLALVHKTCEQDPPPLPATCSSQIRDLCLSLLQKDPQRRPTIQAILGMPRLQTEIRRLKSASK